MKRRTRQHLLRFGSTWSRAVRVTCMALGLYLGVQEATAHAAAKQRPERRRAKGTPAPVTSAIGTSARQAGAHRVEVEVVEVAGGRAYLSPGGSEHVRVGDQIRMGGRLYPVVSVNAKNVVIGLGSQRLVRGQRGSVTVRVTEAKTFETRGTPRLLRAFVGQWQPPRLPAESQTPRFVPLGVMTDTRRNRAAFMLDYQRIEPLSGPAATIGRTRLRAVLHAELSSAPVSLDADGFAELWHAQDLDQRPENASRPVFNIRQLELGYRGEVVQGALGRLRYASRTLGTLDGARVSTTFAQDWSLSAFGGTLANPLDGNFDTEASRFGAELGWQDDDAPARPRASLTLQGSRFAGTTDERRVTGLFETYPGFGRLGARAEVSFFDADNPWAASTTELSAAGADASVKIHSLRLGAAFDMRRPERSLWLSTFLPAGYFCVARAVAGAIANEPCIGGDRRYATALNAAWEATFWTLDGGASYTTTEGAEADQTTAFLNFRRREIVELLRLDTGVSASRSSLSESAALNVGMGMSSSDDAADVSLYYRPSLARYRIGSQQFVEHGIGSRLWWAPSEVLDLSGSLELVTGRDVDVLVLMLGAAWHPRF